MFFSCCRSVGSCCVSLLDWTHIIESAFSSSLVTSSLTELVCLKRTRLIVQRNILFSNTRKRRSKQFLARKISHSLDGSERCYLLGARLDHQGACRPEFWVAPSSLVYPSSVSTTLQITDGTLNVYHNLRRHRTLPQLTVATLPSLVL
jgi:hypothetical protein